MQYISSFFKDKLNKKDILSLLKFFGIFILFLFSSLLQLIIVPFLHYDIEHLTARQNLILSAFSDAVLLIILALVYHKTLINDIKKIKKNFNRDIETGIKYWIVGLVVMMVSNVIIGLFTKAQAVNEESVQELIHSSKYLSLFTVGIMAPIIEELVFRKSFRDIFKNNAIFIFASGLIFGGLHVVLSLSSWWDFLYIIPYSSLGIAFAYMYVKTDNIYTSIFIHMIHNTALTILSIVSTGVILWWNEEKIDIKN